MKLRKKFQAAGKRGHDSYFRQLSAALKAHGLMRPTLVVDEARLAQNAATMVSHLPEGMACRIVVKSLPSPPLVRRVMELAGTGRLMIFDQPFLSQIAEDMPQADVLFGKPMPVALAARFYDGFKGGAFDPARQVQWLIDTPQRLREYAALAESRNLDMRINVEIDVGLHRGGLANPRELAALLDEIDASPRLTFAGLMGYDAHLAKIPAIGGWRERALEKSRTLYKAMRQVTEERYPERAAELTFNTAGSLTYKMHKDLAAGTEIAIGSALVKPADFDHETLADHVPAGFIATSVLKVREKTEIPGLERLSGLTAIWDRNTARSFFIYGGNWQAHPVSPPGLQENKLYGRSSNQEMLNGSRETELAVDDHVFLRPAQSEFVFLQFGDIAVYRDGRITDFWPVYEPERRTLPPPSRDI